MRAYVTGGRGFVGTHLVAHLRASGDEVVLGDADVTDAAAVADEMAGAAPDAVYHLAGLAHVGSSWADPVGTFKVNALGTVAVLAAAASVASTAPRLLVVSSAEVYGRVAPTEVPLTEEAPLRPVSPYAASKAAAELAAVQAHLGSGLAVVRARAFNHAGPGQAPSFLIPVLARRIVAAEREGRDTVAVGNLEPRRDFTDVRDVVRAYRLLIERGTPGEVYNVCTGRAVAVEEVARRLLGAAGSGAELVVDPELVRPVDVPVLQGDPSKLQAATGWAPEHDLDATLAAVLDEARAEADEPRTEAREVGTEPT